MPKDEKLSLSMLVAIIIGSTIGGGIFALAGDMAKGASTGAILLGWLICGVGVLTLVLAYQELSMRKPELTGGIFSYAKEGFGDYMGFNSAWGYWLNAWICNVSYATLLFGALGYFFPVFETGNNAISIICASIILWGIHLLVLRGVKEAALMNLITTTAKIIPVILFLIIIVFTKSFKFEIFMDNFWGDGQLGSVFGQVKSTMLVTLWAFIGVEGAIAVSGRARHKEDIGKATIMGFIGLFAIYFMVSILTIGVMPRAELAALPNPSMAYVLENVVGHFGAVLINVGLIISLAGAMLGWTIISAEVLYETAKQGVLPKVFAKTNKSESPINALWLTNGLVQFFLIITYFTSSTYQVLYFIATTTILVPYLFSALYYFKLAITGETFDQDSKGKQLKAKIVGILASLYGVWLIFAAGMANLLVTAILYAPSIVFYVKAKKERNKEVFTQTEKYIALGIIISAVAAVVLIFNGSINPFV